MDVYVTLTDEPHTVMEISRMSGIPHPTVSRALRFKLQGKKLAEKISNQWVLGPSNPEDYNPETDSFCGPIVANRLARYEKERKDYAKKRKKKTASPDPVHVDLETGEKIQPSQPVDDDDYETRKSRDFCFNCCKPPEPGEYFPVMDDGDILCFDCCHDRMKA